MAKAGFWLRGAHGKLAGSTVYQSKSGTVIREIKTPSNPRTEAQMKQRSQFLAAVRFYQRANQRFFKFAFENKRKGESDYNAFMRLNAGLGAYITKPQADAVGFPMVAPFRVAQGSLVSPTYGVDLVAHGEESHVQLLLGAAGYGSTAPTTIGEVSALLLETYPSMRSGDIITLVSIYSTVASDFYDDLDASAITPSDEVIWTIAQFFVDVNDVRGLDEVGLTASIQGSNVYLERVIAPTGSIGGGFVCVSRNEAGGLKVSNTTVALTSDAADAYEVMRSNAHLEQVLAWWGASQPAILQGGAMVQSGLRITGVDGDSSLPVSKLLDSGDSDVYVLTFDGDSSGVTQNDFRAEGAGVDKFEYAWDYGESNLTVQALDGASGEVKVYFKRQHILTITI